MAIKRKFANINVLEAAKIELKTCLPEWYACIYLFREEKTVCALRM